MKKKKRKVLSKKEKIIIFCAGALAFLIVLSLALMPTRRNKREKINPEDIDLNKSLETVQDVVEYLESDFISMEDSKTEGYDIDIYVNFKYNLYEENISKEPYFQNFYEKIAIVTNFKSFRMIDSSKNITIEVTCTSNGISEVKINGDVNYYKNEESKRAQKEELKVETIEMDINSEELKSLIKAKWNINNVNLGTQESTFNKYRIYFDEGFEVRVIQGKVFNVVFNKKYKGKVVEDYKVGDRLENIEATLGTSYKDNQRLGYKTKDFYVVFSDNEISIYPNYDYDYTEFENLVKEYNNKKDINDFMDKLTDIWPDYDNYSYDTNYVTISYVLKGVKISFSSKSNDGIQIYENYKGSFKQEKPEYTNLYYKLNESLIIVKEKQRKMEDMFEGNEGAPNDIRYSSKFCVLSTLEDGYYKKVKIRSLDENYPNNELDDTLVLTSYAWADDIHLIYGVSENGLYIYNAETRETEKILSGQENFKITNYDRNTNIIEYDDKKAKIDI